MRKFSLHPPQDPSFFSHVSPVCGPSDQTQGGAFSCEARASLQVNASVPKGIRVAYSMVHGPRDVVGPDHLVVRDSTVQKQKEEWKFTNSF